MARNEEKLIRSVLGADIPMSDEANGAMREAFAGIRKDAASRRAAKSRAAKAGSWGFRVAAAVCAVSLGMTGVVYAATQTDLVASVFGTQGRQSAAPETLVHQFSDEDKAIGKEDFEFLMPGREYVEPSVEDVQLVQPYVSEVGESIEAAGCKVTVMANVTDGQRGSVSFMVENPDGLPELDTSSPGAIIKGVKITDELPIAWRVTNGSDGGSVASKLTADVSLSSDKCWYLTENYLMMGGGEGDTLAFEVLQNNGATSDTGLSWTPAGSIDISCGKVPSRSISLEGHGISVIDASALGASIRGLDVDACRSMALVFQDSSRYEVLACGGDSPMDNTNYICGFDEARDGAGFNLEFNRIVDWDKVSFVEINGEAFPI